MIWIVSGPTSSGKSTFLDSSRAVELTGMPRGTPVWFPKQIGAAAPTPTTDAYVHYNILRPFQRARPGDELAVAPGLFERDEAWRAIVALPHEKKAVVLTTDRATLIERVKSRRLVESEAADQYGAAKWLRIYESVDLDRLMQEWRVELSRRAIPFVEVDGGPAAGGWTKESVENLLASENFKYHRVPLPFGLATPGQDRSATAAAALPATLAGQSVLDVGCALGYFSFEAEKRGASRVVGVELRDDRFRQAQLLKSVLGSRVEFVQKDVLRDDLGGPFDVVLLLNVIHHLAEPMSALRRLAAVARRRLVVEFPTFRDERFRRNTGIAFPGRYDKLPLIGVSSMTQGVGQTFVFTPEAIRRVLTDHERLFDRVEFVKSPMKGRMIAVAEKN